MIDDDEAYGLHCDIGRLEQENVTLRQQLEDVTVSMGRLEERHAKTFEVGKRWMAKAARFESENTKLRELIYERAHEHAIQHMTEDELRITLANALDENCKLRKLCEDCAIELYANGNITDAATENLFDDMRKLGIKVGK